jgi:transposase InsO family protein
MSPTAPSPPRLGWARLRFAILGPLLAAPPESGELAAALASLAAKTYRHPTRGEPVRFSAKTIERWFYAARREQDPMGALARKVPSHAGTHPSISTVLATAIRAQHHEHPRWTYQLHYDNLVARTKDEPALVPMPGYATIGRFMKSQGLLRHQRKTRHDGEPHEQRETRSYESAYVNGLWHTDFHACSRKVLTAAGQWRPAFAFGVLDDRSRLCCHLQWYLAETAQWFAHGTSQAIQKRGLPRCYLSDNGAAMVAAEIGEGLERLGIAHKTTLPYSPEQNGKQESFWGRVEGRLMPMLEGEPNLTLELLNRATMAWVEEEYQRTTHSEIGEPPLTRFLRGPSVSRPSPSSDALRRAFRMEVSRTQRRSDGTVTVAGVRFEIPSAYRTLTKVSVRVARWDLSSVDLVDPRTGKDLSTLLPLDRTKNADGRRRVVSPRAPPPAPTTATGVAPLLRQLMSDYAATGLPPGYLPVDEHDRAEEETQP